MMIFKNKWNHYTVQQTNSEALLISALWQWKTLHLVPIACHVCMTIVEQIHKDKLGFLFFFLWASCSNHCLAALDLGADVEQPFDCLIVQNRQAMQSMGRSMDWTLKDNMVDVFFCATLTGLRGGHTPFVQSGAENLWDRCGGGSTRPTLFLGGLFQGVGCW